MTPTDKSPRSFWINQIDQFKYDAYACEVPGFDFHTIEHSAYLAVKQELEAARAENNRLTYELDKSRDSHMKIIAQQNAQIANYEAALERYTNQETYGDLAVGSFIPRGIAMEVLNKWKK